MKPERSLITIHRRLLVSLAVSSALVSGVAVDARAVPAAGGGSPDLSHVALRASKVGSGHELPTAHRTLHRDGAIE